MSTDAPAPPVDDPGRVDPVASVVVVAWRDAPHLEACLAAFAQSAPRVAHELIVVANEPTVALVRRLPALAGRATVLRSEANLGFGGAVNLAASRARGELLALLNDDARPEPGWLDELVAAHARHPGAAAVGGLTLFPDGRVQEAGSVVWADGWTTGVGRGETVAEGRFLADRRVDYCSAANLAVRRAAFLGAGGFDDLYYPAYFEDVDLCLRLRSGGGEIWFTAAARVRHGESKSTNATFRAFLMETNHARFVGRWSDQLGARPPRDTSPTGIERAVCAAAGAEARLLVIDDRTPDPAFGSGLGRMADVLTELSAVGRYLVTFFAGAEGGIGATDRLERLGVEHVRTDLVAYRGRLGDAIADHLATRPTGYEAVLVSRPHNYERYAATLRALLPGVPLLYDAEAVYSRRLERQAALAPDLVTRLALERELAAMQRLEAAIATGADAIVCICEEEAEVFRHLGGRAVLVNPPQLAGAAPTPAGFAERAGIAFVAGWGAGGASPNADGLIWFVRNVLGRVRARVPDARLYVSGAEPPRNVRRLEGPAVELGGKVEDLAELYGRVRVAIVPVRSGAGVKLKTVEALQHGVPVVATTVGAEGIALDEPGALAIADEPAAFADALVALLTDAAAWEAQRRAIEQQERRWAQLERPSVWRDLVDAVCCVGAPR